MAIVALAQPPAWGASDIWGNVGPASPLGSDGLWGRYPLGHYALDQHFEGVSASLTGGVDVSGVAPMIAYFLASVLWALTSFLASALISLFAFAFSLDLLNGSRATGGAGALAPVSQAIHSIYSSVFGGPWLTLAVAIAGIWAIWKVLIQRRYTEAAGALGLSLIYVVLALFFVIQPAKTIGTASEWTNKMSVAFLSVASHGEVSGGERAKDGAAEQLFDLLVFKPWAVMEFGGLEHCAVAGSGSEDSDPDSVAVRPLSADPSTDAALARRLAAGTEVSAGRKSCVNNANKYASHFLRFGLGTDERDAEYDALDHGDSSKLPDADTERRGYRLGIADKPATDAMEEGGQYQRLLVAIVVFFGELGAFCLIGALSVGVILAQVLLLLLLAFAPVALVAAAIPGRGHAFFRGWLEKLVGFLLRKAAYSLVLAILLAVNGALAAATSSLGWFMSFSLQALFFWAVILQRQALVGGLIGIATGPGAPGRGGSLRLLALYSGARAVRRPLRGLRRSTTSAVRAPARLMGGGSRSRRGGRYGGIGLSGSTPRFGTSHSAPLGASAKGTEPKRPSRRVSAGPGQAEGGEGGRSAAPEKASGAPRPTEKGAGRRGRAAEAALTAAAREASAGARAAKAQKRAKPGVKQASAGAERPAKPTPKEGREARRREAEAPGPPHRQDGANGPGSLEADLRAEREHGGKARRGDAAKDASGSKASPRRRRRGRAKDEGQ